MTAFTKVVLYTDADGRAKFRDEPIPLSEGAPEFMLSSVFPSSGYQLRHSPPGFRTQIHCPDEEKWIFILSGEMEIGLLNSKTRLFKAGEHFVSADTLPKGTIFDPAVHGHWARQVGASPLVTLFVKI